MYCISNIKILNDIEYFGFEKNRIKMLYTFIYLSIFEV